MFFVSSILRHHLDLPSLFCKLIFMCKIMKNMLFFKYNFSITKGSQNDLQNQPKSSAELLGRVTIGRLEPSGSALNISGHVQSQDMPLDRFITHNMTRVSDYSICDS